MNKYIAVIVVLALVFLVAIDQNFIPENFSTVEQDARAQCIQKRGAHQPPLSFRYDGCTLWPNGDWASCCAVHDATYWCGGSAQDRVRADATLKNCVNKKTPFWGSVMYYGTRIGGIPWIPWQARWGFGWKFGKGYK